MHDERELARQAAGQHSLLTTEQLRAAGLTASGLSYRTGRGRLRPVHRGVYAVAGIDPSFEQRLLAACLCAGLDAVASHRSALVLWDISPLDEETVEISVRRHRALQIREVVVHRSLDLSSSDIVRRRRIPVTKPARALVDAGAVLPPWAVERSLEMALSARLVTVGGVRGVLDALSERGRSGCGVIREILDNRALGERKSESELEWRMAKLCCTCGLPRLAYQHELTIAGRRRRVDFAVPELRIAIEVDGYEHHSRRAVWQDDLQRQNELQAAGWIVLRFSWADVLNRPDRVASVIRRVLGSRSRDIPH